MYFMDCIKNDKLHGYATLSGDKLYPIIDADGILIGLKKIERSPEEYHNEYGDWLFSVEDVSSESVISAINWEVV